MNNQSSMFGDIPTTDVTELVNMALDQKHMTKEELYKELMVIYGVDCDTLEKREDFPALWKLICDTPNIQRRHAEWHAKHSQDFL